MPRPEGNSKPGKPEEIEAQLTSYYESTHSTVPKLPEEFPAGGEVALEGSDPSTEQSSDQQTRPAVIGDAEAQLRFFYQSSGSIVPGEK